MQELNHTPDAPETALQAQLDRIEAQNQKIFARCKMKLQ